jgi:outer membrane protein assembly factor BamB
MICCITMNSTKRTTRFAPPPRLLLVLLQVAAIPLAWLALSAPGTSAAIQPETSNQDSGQPAGDPSQESDSPLEDLNYAAVRVPAAEDFLRRLPAGDLPESSFQTLHEIFSLPEDAFLADPVAGRWLGLRQTALEKLRLSSFSTQQAWNRTAISSAEAAWNDAVHQGDPAGAARIAAGWPLSEYHLRLTLLQALEAAHSGESDAAAAAINRTLSQCRGTALEARATALLRPLEIRLRPTPLPAAPNTVTTTPHTVSAPWPRPAWRWQEHVRQQDAERQEAESTLLLSKHPETAARMRLFELWKPRCWGPWIISRTPSRLVALDRRSGAESWWLDTDQALRDPALPHHEDDSGDVIWQLSPGNRTGIVDTRLDTRWGVLAADDECLWLVDRLPVLTGFDLQSGPFPNARINPWLPDELQPDTANVGTRLVCLRRPGTPASDSPDAASLPPQVAWTIGEGSWQYRVATPDGTTLKHSPSQQMPAAGPPPQAHQMPAVDSSDRPAGTATDNPPTDTPATRTPPALLFASGPAVHGNRLFILAESQQTEQLEVLCLNRLNGHIIWRQPLLQLNMLHSLREAAGNICQSVCLICGDTVICSLEGAILAAVDLRDGHSRWMLPLTRIQSNDAALFPMPFGDQPAAATVQTRCPFQPAASGKIVICAAPNSSDLQAIEAATGNVVWKVPRLVSGSTGPGGSPDMLVAGLFDHQLILVGERHCRSLEPATGAQKWVIETGLCSGTPLCSPDRIVLPQLDGRPLVVDLHQGQRVEQSELFLPAGARGIFGALNADEQSIFSGTGGVVLAWERADQVALGASANAPAPAKGTTAPQLTPVQQLQAMLLNGDRQSAEELRNRLQLPSELLGEAWLLEFGNALEQTPATDAPAAPSLPAELLLTPPQQLRLQLLTAIATSRHLAGIHGTEDRLQQLSSGWSVSLPALQPSRLPQQTDAATLQSLSLAELRRLAESACLHPTETASPAVLKLLIQELSRRGLAEAAELVAAAWWLEATTAPTLLAGADQAAEQLLELRRTDDRAAGHSKSGLQSASAGPLTATSFLQLRSTEPAAADPEGEDLALAVPWWLSCDVRLEVASETGRKLLTLDPAGAGILDQVPVSAEGTGASITFRQTSRLLSAPGLLPVLADNQLQLTAIHADGRIRRLWSQELIKAEQGVADPEFGPLWPGGLIIHSGDHLSCLHPLTGRPLWKRRLAQELDYSGLLPSRLFGDHEAVAILGTDAASIESFRASDGRPLQRGTLQIGRGTECGTVGRFLIYTDLAYRLHVFDAATGTERLQQEPPVTIAATQTESLFATLPGNRILTITDTGELVLVDLQNGQQIFRTKLPPAETMAAVSGIQAVESGGRLLVELENIGGAAAGGFGAAMNMPFRQQAGFGALGMGIGEELRRLPRGVALEIDDGLLCCLDATTGQLLWVQPRYDCRLQQIAGDPTDLVLLTELRYGRSEDPDGGLAQHVNLEVLHADTGEVLLQAGKISMSGIHTAWHDATTAEIRLMATDGQVVIQKRK